MGLLIKLSLEEVLFLFLCNNYLNSFLELRDIGIDGIPDNVIVDTEIVVDYFITNITHIAPGNKRVFRLEIRINFIAGFADYFEATATALVNRSFARNSSNVNWPDSLRR